MKTIRDMLGKLGRDRSSGQTGHHMYQFEANPSSCDKCKNADGEKAYGSTKPKMFPHAPEHDGEYNCKCPGWVKKY